MNKERNQVGEELLLEMEADANAFNLKCLAVLCGITLLCALCNRIGIFRGGQTDDADSSELVIPGLLSAHPRVAFP